MRAVTVGRPCAPVVTEDVAGEEGRFLRRTLGAQAAGRAGLVVLRLFRAGCTGLQVLLLGNFCREAVQRKGRLDGHGALGHGERIAVQGEVLRLHHLPAVEVQRKQRAHDGELLADGADAGVSQIQVELRQERQHALLDGGNVPPLRVENVQAVPPGELALDRKDGVAVLIVDIVAVEP